MSGFPSRNDQGTPVRTTPSEILRRGMFGPEQAPAEVLAIRESSGDDDASFYRVRYTGLAHPSGVSPQHLVLVNNGHPFRADCWIGSAQLEHRAETGNVTLIPAGCEWRAVLPKNAEKMIVALPTARFSTAVAQSGGVSDRIGRRLRGKDPSLAAIMGELAQTVGFPDRDRSAWHQLVDELADHLAVAYPIRGARLSTGRLSADTLMRLNAYVDERLDQALAIDDLADVAKSSRSHFPRLFRRTVGMSPHQYVMRLRLRRARRLIQGGGSLAEVAAAAGFADQSHLTNWVRRVYGTTPGKVSAHR